MRKTIWLLLFLVVLENAVLAQEEAQRAKPRLVLVIVADQFRYDYLLRFGSEFQDGLKTLLARGASFTNAHYDHFPTYTSVGHAALLTGSYPAVNGIIGNKWFDRRSGKVVPSALDDSARTVGGKGEGGSSPRNLQVSTIGDEMKIADARSKVIGISFKDYSGILATGHMADAVYWFDLQEGNFVSSSHYLRELPGWLTEFNSGRPTDKYMGKEWMGVKLPTESGRKLNGTLLNTAFGNELLEEMAEAAIRGEKLGQDALPDLLVLSFSSNDYVGHRYGPDSAQVRDVSLATDRVIGKLFRFIDSEIGLGNVTVVFTSDHGVAPLPELNQQRKMPGGRASFQAVIDGIKKALDEQFGVRDWLQAAAENSIYLNYDLIRSSRLSVDEVTEEAARAARLLPNVFRVYTRAQLLNSSGISDAIGRRVVQGYHSSRGGDLVVLLDPYYQYGSGTTTHGSPFGYDTHVPVIFMGPGINAGRYHSGIVVNDIAPTLATILDIEIPSGSEGKILSEIFFRSE